MTAYKSGLLVLIAFAMFGTAASAQDPIIREVIFP